MALEHEKAQMLKDFHNQKEIVISEHEKEMDCMKETHQNELYELKCRVQEKQDKDTKVSQETFVTRFKIFLLDQGVAISWRTVSHCCSCEQCGL